MQKGPDVADCREPWLRKGLRLTTKRATMQEKVADGGGPRLSGRAPVCDGRRRGNTLDSATRRGPFGRRRALTIGYEAVLI